MRGILPLALAAACASFEAEPEPSWTSLVAWEGEHPLSGVAIGDADPLSPGLEVVGAAEGGDVILVRFRKGAPRAEVVLRHGRNLTGLLVADLDPALEGNEIYVGGTGTGGDDSGVVYQLHAERTGVRAKRILEPDGYVHAMARLDGAPPQLVVTTYSGSVLLAAPGPSGWAARRIHEEPRSLGVEGRKIKDVRTGPFAGRPARTVFFAAKSGRCVALDPDDPSKTELCRIQPGGVARISDVDRGAIWLACNDGSVLRLERRGEGFAAEEHFRSKDQLRGVVLGRFAVPGDEARLAVHGYDRVCRAILGPGADFPLVEDSEQGHWLAAGDLFPGNGSDELALANLSGKILVVYRRGGATS